MRLNSREVLESYIKGKDEDQYKLLEALYSESAELEFEIDSEDISFPTHINGNLTIAKVLSKDFNKKYSKVKTYYLTKPEVDQYSIRQQKWLVVMQDNSDAATRIGTGYYHWQLAEAGNTLQIQKHKIYIHSMLRLEDNQASELRRIQTELEYPWIETTAVIQTLANNPDYEHIVAYLTI